MKKLSLFLTFALMLSFCVSCGSEQSAHTETTTGNETEASADMEQTRLYPEIPEEIDYGGYEFRIYGFKGAYTEQDDYTAEETGEVISDAIYKRNLAVSELLNINITATAENSTKDKVTANVLAGDDFADLVFSAGFEMPASVLAGNFIELTGDTSLMLDMPWYDAKCIIERFADPSFVYNDHHDNFSESKVLFANGQALFHPYGLGQIFYLRPAYYEIALKVKYSSDLASAKMLDLIFDNRSYDPSIIYQIGNVVSTYSGLYNKVNTAVASTFENIRSSAQSAADKFIDSFNAMRQYK